MKVGLSLQIDFEDVKHLLASYLDIQTNKIIKLSREMQDCAIDMEDEKNFSKPLNGLNLVIEKMDAIKSSIVEIGELYVNYANVVTNGVREPRPDAGIENISKTLEESVVDVESALQATTEATENVQALLGEAILEEENVNV